MPSGKARTSHQSEMPESATGILIICDLDRVAINCEERFAQAEREHKKGTPEYWRAALDPKKFHLDQPLAEAIEHLEVLVTGAHLCYLTSRPGDCYEATVAFLRQYGYPCPEQTICRPVRKRLTTPRYKSLAVRALAYGISHGLIHRHFWLATSAPLFFLCSWWSQRKRANTTIIFIDDNERNRQTVAASGLNIMLAANLVEARTLKEGVWKKQDNKVQ